MLKMASKSFVKVENFNDSASDSTDNDDDDENQETISSAPKSLTVDTNDENDISDSTFDSQNSDLNDEKSDSSFGENSDEESSKKENELDDKKQGGLASVMDKLINKSIIGSKSKSVILSKAKTDREIQWKKRQADLESNNTEGEGEIKKAKTDEVFEDSFKKMEQMNKRKKWEETGHIKPNVLDKDVERKLQRIATRGVVQLFNAVKKQQKIIDEKIKEVGPSETKKEKVLNSMSKGDFLDMLKGSSVSNVTNEPAEKQVKPSPTDHNSNIEKSTEKQTLWTALRDDFMMNSKMKDWDKDDSDNNSVDNSNHDESDSE